MLMCASTIGLLRLPELEALQDSGESMCRGHASTGMINGVAAGPAHGRVGWEAARRVQGARHLVGSSLQARYWPVKHAL